MRPCTANLEEHLPDSYNNITHTTIAEMLANEGLVNETHTIQISTCHRYASVCFETRETLLKFTNTEHFILSDYPITFQPDHDDKICISIENLPIELPETTFLSKYTTPVGKTYYPGIKHQNKFYTTGTRVYKCIKLTQHIPKHIYQFGRYLCIRYDDQPKDQQKDILDTPITQLSDNTPETQEQEIPQQETQHELQPQQEIQKQHQPQRKEYNFNEYIQRTTQQTKVKKTEP